MDDTIVFLVVGLIGLVMLFAQVRLFNIDQNLSRILEILEQKPKEQNPGR